MNISKKEIAEKIGCHRCSVYREIKRNKAKKWYKASYAQEMAENRKERFNHTRKFTTSIKNTIIEKLSKEQWSPEQLVGWAKLNNVDMVSHETIYQFVYKDKQSGGSLYKHLRIASNPYRKRYGSKDHRGKIKNRVGIDKRPTIVEERKRIGDWEVDTVMSKNRSTALLTMVERASLFLQVDLLDRKTADLTKKKMVNRLAPFKKWVHTITGDNGTEFTNHEEIAKKLQADFYFTAPYSSWQKGTNENTNGLLRQYFPKGTEFKGTSYTTILNIVEKLNNRPRKSLGYRTPKQVFFHNFH